MLAEVVTRLADALDTGIFGRVYPMVRQIVEMTDQGRKIYPGYNISKGQYKHVLEDTAGGVLYHRINGDIRSTGKFETTSCGSLITLEYPLRQAAFLPRDIMQCHDIHADEEIALWLIKHTMAADIGTGTILVSKELKSVTLDSQRVAGTEYSQGIIDINYEWSYVSIDWMLMLTFDVNCICHDLY